MAYLDAAALRAFDAHGFRARKPYPWANPAGLLTDAGFDQLHRTLPDVSQFEAIFGKRRKYGQMSHDRLSLDYRAGLDLPPAWQAFIEELQGDEYTAFVRRMFGCRNFRLKMHWHYTPAGKSVSPHCDSLSKIGSQIFYFNTPEDWDPAWGGETVILDDKGKFSSRSAPGWDAFDKAIPAQALGNRSLIFARKPHSWHGVRAIACPPDRLRRVFIVVIEFTGVVDQAVAQIPGLRDLVAAPASVAA